MAMKKKAKAGEGGNRLLEDPRLKKIIGSGRTANVNGAKVRKVRESDNIPGTFGKTQESIMAEQREMRRRRKEIEDAKKATKKARGGMMKSKMKAKGMKAGGKMTSKMKAKGMKAGGKMKAKGMAKGGMKTKGYMAGGLKDAPEGNKGLKKLPKKVRNKMGFKAKGGMMKTKGYAKGGMKSKMSSKGGAKGGKKPTTQKVRGAGIARKGVRPAKMR